MSGNIFPEGRMIPLGMADMTDAAEEDAAAAAVDALDVTVAD